MKSNFINISSAQSTISPSPNTSLSSLNLELYPPEIEIIFKTMYTIIIVSALVLNGIVCYIYKRRQVKQSTFNFLLVLLSITDMTSALFITPYVYVEMYDITSLSKQCMNYLCAITTGLSLYWISTFTSTCILCLISLTRYLAISSVTKRSWIHDKSFIKKLYAIFWVTATLATAPNAITFYFEQKRRICLRSWPTWLNPSAYVIGTAVVGLTPITIMLSTLFGSIKALWFKKASPGSNSFTIKKRKQIVLLLAILALVFAVCFTPPAVYWILSWGTSFFPKGVKRHYSRVRALKIVILMASSNTVWDPIIYAVRSEEFRGPILEVFSTLYYFLFDQKKKPKEPNNL